MKNQLISIFLIFSTLGSNISNAALPLARFETQSDRDNRLASPSEFVHEFQALTPSDLPVNSVASPSVNLVANTIERPFLVSFEPDFVLSLEEPSFDLEYIPTTEDVDNFISQLGKRVSRSIPDRLTCWVTRNIGSWAFVGGQACIILTWIGWNSFSSHSWDAHPFILLNLLLSFQAEFLASFIFMSQRADEAIDRIQNSDLEKKVDQVLRFSNLQNDLSLADPEQISKSLGEMTEMPFSFQCDASRVIQPAGVENKLTCQDKLTDFIAAHLCSWKYVFFLSCSFIGWMELNSRLHHPFDPYPFQGLNLFLTVASALNGPLIMISENRQALLDRRERAKLHFKVDSIRWVQKKQFEKQLALILPRPSPTSERTN